MLLIFAAGSPVLDQPAATAGSAEPRPLADQPLADQEKSILRRDQGFITPVLVRQDVGG